MEAIRKKLDCEDIDFFGDHSVNLSDIMAYILLNKSEWIDKNLIKQVDTFQLKSLCTNFNFNTERQDIHRTSLEIPLLKRSAVKNCKQFVIGRVSQLYPYYKDNKRFITLDLPNDIWSDKYTYSMKMNDLFIYCAVNANKHCKHSDLSFFPIRLVLSRKDGFLIKKKISKRLSAEQSDMILRYDKDKRFGSILAREVCQLIVLFGCNLYQSTTYPHIFFLKRGPIVKEKGLVLID